MEQKKEHRSGEKKIMHGPFSEVDHGLWRTIILEWTAQSNKLGGFGKGKKSEGLRRRLFAKKPREG